MASILVVQLREKNQMVLIVCLLRKYDSVHLVSHEVPVIGHCRAESLPCMNCINHINRIQENGETHTERILKTEYPSRKKCWKYAGQISPQFHTLCAVTTMHNFTENTFGRL